MNTEEQITTHMNSHLLEIYEIMNDHIEKCSLINNDLLYALNTGDALMHAYVSSIYGDYTKQLKLIRKMQDCEDIKTHKAKLFIRHMYSSCHIK
jgi:hypothetical protein